MLSKLLADWVAHYITVGIGRYELLIVERPAIVVRDRDDVALSPAHARDFFVNYDGLAVAD